LCDKLRDTEKNKNKKGVDLYQNQLFILYYYYSFQQNAELIILKTNPTTQLFQHPFSYNNSGKNKNKTKEQQQTNKQKITSQFLLLHTTLNHKSKSSFS